MVPYVLDCWVDNMRLLYGNKTRTTRFPDGVHVRVPGLGNTSTVEWLDPSQVSPTAYFRRIVEALIALGYQRGIDVRGAPYDFRKAPNELDGYFEQLHALIEDSYTSNRNMSVIMATGVSVQNLKDTFHNTLYTLIRDLPKYSKVVVHIPEERIKVHNIQQFSYHGLLFIWTEMQLLEVLALCIQCLVLVNSFRENHESSLFV
ncbi:hypothetical protein MRX96_045051 [Rhipicephalus microplus]